MSVRLYFFAGIRERLGLDEADAAGAGKTVAELADELALQRGAAWSVLAEPSTLCAVNQAMAPKSTRLQPGDEVAFFPPVTGG